MVPPSFASAWTKGRKNHPCGSMRDDPHFSVIRKGKQEKTNQAARGGLPHRWSRSGCNRSDHSGRGPTWTLSQHGQIFGGTDEEVTPPCKEKPLPRSARPLASTLPPSTSSRQRKKGKGERRKKKEGSRSERARETWTVVGASNVVCLCVCSVGPPFIGPHPNLLCTGAPIYCSAICHMFLATPGPKLSCGLSRVAPVRPSNTRCRTHETCHPNFGSTRGGGGCAAQRGSAPWRLSEYAHHVAWTWGREKTGSMVRTISACHLGSLGSDWVMTRRQPPLGIIRCTVEGEYLR